MKDPVTVRDLRHYFKPYIKIIDRKDSGVAGGTFTQDAWQTRTLNEEVSDTGSHASLSSSQITLDEGTYEAEWSAPAFQVNNHQTRLANIDDTIEYYGTSEYSASTDTATTRSSGFAIFTITSSKVFELQHRCSATKASQGFGVENAFGNNNIYAMIKFRKLV